MVQAKAKSTTRALSKPLATSFIDPATFPDLYGMVLQGDCLDPAVPHGAAVAFDKTIEPKVGDFVCIWLRPERTRPGQHQRSIKRLSMAIPPWVKFPWVDHPESDVRPLFQVEYLNPPAIVLRAV